MWSEGICALMMLERDRGRGARRDSAEEGSASFDNELRDQDVSDGAAFFNDRAPAQPASLADDALLLSDLKKKASDGDQRKWGEASRLQAGSQGRCCSQNS